LKYFLVFLFVSQFYCASFCQLDTTINDARFTILEKYDNGDTKLVGQFNTNCTDTIIRKHGWFLEFDQNGEETKRELYFYDQKRNKKFFGLKYGWWGWYGMTTKYVFGLQTKKHITDPCF
jgi:hypothetical protein